MQCLLLRIESRSAREVSCHPPFMESAQLLVKRVRYIYLVDEFFLLFLVYPNEMRMLSDPRILFFLFLVLIRWNEEGMRVQDFFFLPPGRESFVSELPEA